MDGTKLLVKIGELIDTKLDQKLRPINEKLETLDLKIEVVNSKIDKLDKKIDKTEEETIETLSELITSGHSLHEKRIKKIEDHLQLPQTQ